MEENSATVIPFPIIVPYNCEQCKSVLFGRDGLYCREFHEDVGSGDIAAECAFYDPES